LPPCLAPRWPIAKGDADFYRRLLRGFVTEATGVDNQEVRTDLDQGALERAAARLHRLRGAAANLGALELARSARHLEGSIQNGGPLEWGESLIAFSTRLAALLDSASQWLADTSSPPPLPRHWIPSRGCSCPCDLLVRTPYTDAVRPVRP
jgi:HPt (histidine-containing phosphotransfer) domain-containing protein